MDANMQKSSKYANENINYAPKKYEKISKNSNVRNNSYEMIKKTFINYENKYSNF